MYQTLPRNFGRAKSQEKISTNPYQFTPIAPDGPRNLLRPKAIRKERPRSTTDLDDLRLAEAQQKYLERQKSQEIFRAHTGSKQSQKYQNQTTATIKGQSATATVSKSTTAKSTSTAATKKESDVVDHYKNNQLKILSGSHVKKSQKKEFHLRKKEESESVTESKVKTTHTAYATKQLQEKGVKTIGYNRETRKEVTQKAAVVETKQEVTADVYERVKVFARGGVIQLSLEEDDTPKMPPVPQEEMMKIRESSDAHAHYSSKQSKGMSSSYHTSQKTSSANQVALIKQQYQQNQAQQQIQHHHQQTQQQQQQ
jgi:hypothetical protein